MQQIHYNIEKIKEKNALINLIFGEKSNGKSYQVKHLALNNYMENGKRFILLRRWVADVTTLWIEQYFQDVDVEKLTNGKYNTITVFRKTLYFGKFNEEKGKVDKGEKIGYVMALSTEQHYSGASFLDVDFIIYEEFMERGCYIANEPSKLMILYSTIDRKRGDTILWLVGNTISRVNPYIHDWGLDTLFRTIKQGEIKTHEIDTETDTIVIAIEYCSKSGGKALAIGEASKMIDSGNWQTEKQPKLPRSYKDYDIIYRIGFQYNGFRFLGELLRYGNNKCWFIYPYSKEFDVDNSNIYIFSNEVYVSKKWQRDIYNPNIKNDKIKKILQSFKENIIFYSDDLTGTDFKKSIDFIIKR